LVRSRPAQRFTLLILLVGVVGCDTLGYYSQAVSGQLSLLSARRELADVLADPATSEPLQQQLRTVIELRRFAEDVLSLPVEQQFSAYIQLDRDFVVWNVFVAPEFSLDPMTWCFPVAGCSAYRGYFSEQGARRYAGRMARQGYDTWVGGVAAYSTLGWFHDPVLSSWVFREEPRLAELVFHELAHLVLYVPGDTTFNESFATAVALEGVRRWLKIGGDDDLYQRYLDDWAARQRFAGLVEMYRSKLVALYAADLPKAELRARKQALMHEMGDAYLAGEPAGSGGGVYRDWFGADLNNAKLNAVGLYNALVPGLEALLREVDKDLPEFFRRCRELAELDLEERHRQLMPPGA
jgi:predicted aminopeptidase